MGGLIYVKLFQNDRFAVCVLLLHLPLNPVTNSDLTLHVWLRASWPTDTKTLPHPFHTKFKGCNSTVIVHKGSTRDVTVCTIA